MKLKKFNLISSVLLVISCFMPYEGARAEPLNFEAELLKQLECSALPMPTFIFKAFDAIGRLETDAQFGNDSVSCFPITDGFMIDDLMFDSICGFEEDATLPGRSDYFDRAPGTSPGQLLSLQTKASPADLLTWVRQHIASAEADRLVTDRFELDTYGSALECSKWNVK